MQETGAEDRRSNQRYPFKLECWFFRVQMLLGLKSLGPDFKVQPQL